MKLLSYLLTLSLILFLACSGDSDSGSSTTSNSGKSSNELSEFQMEHGLGPVTERIELGDFDPSLAEKGQSIFNMKCSACHQVEGRFVGPEYGDIMERRSAEFVMNMILNPGEMIRQHPEGKKMLAEYMTPMPYQNVKKEEARAIVEYFRSYQQ